jgi:SsrA-binding protein
MKKTEEESGRQVVCRNKRALHDYFIEDRVEAGLVLRGTEVKSLRDGRVDLKDAYAVIEKREVFLVNLNISPWPGASHFNHSPERRRKLLLHRHQIERLSIKIDQRGYTLIPLSIYFTEKNFAKVELGLAKGKRQYDKRVAIRERDERRAGEREEENPRK